MPVIGNASNFAARGVPAAKAPAPAPAAKGAPVANPRTGNNPRGVAIATGAAAHQTISPTNTGRPEGVAKLAAKITPAPSPSNRQAAQVSQSQRLARLVPAMTRGAVADPFAPIATNAPVMTEPLRQMMVQGQFNQDYQTLGKLGLLPSDARQQPPLAFPSEGMGSEGVRSYEVGAGGSGKVNLSPMTVFGATSPEFSGLHSWAESTLIHELAHALQRPSVQKNVVTREGGAQAYADAAVPAVLGPLQTSDTDYSGYVNAVRRMGPGYYMKRQFGS